MKKRLLSILLTLAMVISLFPGMAITAGAEVAGDSAEQIALDGADAAVWFTGAYTEDENAIETGLSAGQTGSLADAFAAATDVEGQMTYVRLNRSVATETDSSYSLSAGANMVLDLAGETIKATASYQNDFYAIKVMAGADLTVKNGTVKSVQTSNTDETSGGIYVEDGSLAVIDCNILASVKRGGEVYGINFCYDEEQDASITVEGTGTISAKTEVKGAAYGIYAAWGGSVAVDGTYAIVADAESNAYGIYLYEVTAASVEGASVDASSGGNTYGICVQDYKGTTPVTVSGWEIEASGQHAWGIGADSGEIAVSGVEADVSATAEAYGMSASYDSTVHVEDCRLTATELETWARAYGMYVATTKVPGAYLGAGVELSGEYRDLYLQTAIDSEDYDGDPLTVETVNFQEDDLLVYNGSEEDFQLVDSYYYLQQGQDGHLYLAQKVSVSWVELDESYLELVTGQTHQLTVTVEPDEATNKAVTWTSSDPAVATVDENGLVTAKGAGYAEITATSVDDPDLDATCSVDVEAGHSHADVPGYWIELTMDNLEDYLYVNSYNDTGHVLTPGNYCLGEDIDLSDPSIEPFEPAFVSWLQKTVNFKGQFSTLRINSGTVNLCLNGNTINGWAGKDSSATYGGTLAVASGATLNLYDCSEDQTGEISGGGDLAHSVQAQSNYGQVKGAAIHNDGTVNLYGGTITGYSGPAVKGNALNDSYNALSVIVNKGTLNLRGGAISGNHTWDAPVIINLGGLTMAGGTVSDNVVEVTGRAIYRSCGGAVYNGGTFTMTGGTIHNNDAAYATTRVDGAGVYNDVGHTFTMTGGTISGNHARGGEGGGGVYNAGTFTMSGSAVIRDNYASEADKGYGMYESSGGGGVTNAGTFHMGTGAVISGNTSAGGEGGGGVYNAGTFTMTNAIISGNTSKNFAPLESVYSGHGGGLRNEGTATITGSYIKDNHIEWTASGSQEQGNGGGIYNTDAGTLTIEDTTITGNSATGYGGVSHESSGQLTLKGDTYILGNTSEYRGSTIASNLITFNKKIAIEDLGSSASIGYTAVPYILYENGEWLDARVFSGIRTPATFTTGAEAGDKQHFSMDHTGYLLKQYADAPAQDEQEHEDFDAHQLYLLEEGEVGGKDPEAPATIVIIGSKTFALENGAAAIDPEVTGIASLSADEEGNVIVVLDGSVTLADNSCGIFSANPIELQVTASSGASITSAASVAVSSGGKVTVNAGNAKLAIIGQGQAISANSGLTTEATVTDAEEDGNEINPATVNLSAYDKLYFNYGASLTLTPGVNDFEYSREEKFLRYTLTAQSWPENATVVPEITLTGNNASRVALTPFNNGTAELTVNIAQLPVGVYTMSISALNGGKTVETVETFTILAKDMSEDAVVTFDPDEKYYDEEEYAGTITVKDGSYTMGNTDYALSFSDKVNVGSTVTVTFMGNYTGTKVVPLPILPVDLGSATLTPNGLVVHKDREDNKGLADGSSITYQGRTLQDGVDYYVADPVTDIVIDEANFTAGVKITFKGNYTGELNLQNVPTKVQLGFGSFSCYPPQGGVSYSGSPHTPSVIRPAHLVEGTDYEVEYVNNVQVGMAKAIVRGLGHYYGELTWSFKINKMQVKSNNSTITFLDNDSNAFYYTGSPIQPQFSIAIQNCVAPTAGDYTLSYGSNTDVNGLATNEGSITLDFSRSNNYSGTVTYYFDIKPVTLTDGTAFINGAVGSVGIVNGTPEAEITWNQVPLATDGTDYELVYDEATATATVTFKGNFKGTYTVVNPPILTRISDDWFQIVDPSDRTYNGTQQSVTVVLSDVGMAAMGVSSNALPEGLQVVYQKDSVPAVFENYGDYDVFVMPVDGSSFIGMADMGEVSIEKAPIRIRPKAVTVVAGTEEPPIFGLELYDVFAGDDLDFTGELPDFTIVDAEDNEIPGTDGTVAGIWEVIKDAHGTYQIKWNNAGTLGLTLTGEHADNYSWDGADYYADLIIQKRPSRPSGDTPVTVPVSNDENKVNVNATLSGQDATIKPLDSQQIEQIVGDTEAAGDVVIDLAALGKNIDTAGIPKTTLEAIVEAAEDAGNDTEHLVIKLSTAELKLDDAAMRAIVDQAKGEIIKFNFDDVGTSRLNAAQKEAVKDMDVRKGFEAYITVNGTRISDFKGGNVEIIVPYAVPAGEDVAGFSVWYIDEQGNPEKLKSTYDGKQKWFVVTHFSDYVIAYSAEDALTGSYHTCPKDETCPIHAYTDALTSAWYHDGIHYCIDNGLMSGYGNGSFKPDDDTTRAMIAMMLWRLEGSPKVDHQLDFADVAEGQWYTDAIRWVNSAGIAAGYDDGRFGADDAVTREQMATMLLRYAQYKGIDVSVGEDTNILSYDDAFEISGYAVPAMQWACGSGIMQGMNDPDGDGMLLAPKSKGTRAQIATMMMRFCEGVVKK